MCSLLNFSDMPKHSLVSSFVVVVVGLGEGGGVSIFFFFYFILFFVGWKTEHISADISALYVTFLNIQTMNCHAALSPSPRGG